MPTVIKRTASLFITLFGALINFALAVQLLAQYKAIRWEPESEWESNVAVWKFDSVKLVWALLSTYFAAAASVCLIGSLGIARRIPSYIKFYRDYSIADVSFCTFFTIVGTYVAFQTPFRATLCEQLSQQPELMREMAELGLSLENCELWIERAVLAFLALMIVLIMLRVHFLIAVSNYYRRLMRHYYSSLPHNSRTRSATMTYHQRIHILPNAAAFSASSLAPSDDFLVYAPVPLDALSPSVAHDIRSTATEVWISRPGCDSDSHHKHAHRHRHHESTSFNPFDHDLGRIRLPISPGEGLLPEKDAHLN